VARSRYTCELARPRDLDVLMVNMEATDGSHHFFWQHFDPSHPRHDPSGPARWRNTIARVYEATDRELGRLIDAYGPDTVFVASDHGGGPSNDLVLYMNDWLAAEGFMAIRARAARSSMARRAYAAAMKRMSVPMKRRLRPLLGGAIERAKGLALYGDVDWSRSQAYATVQSMVRLNLAGREPQGLVRGGDREAVLSQLADRAGAARTPDGEPLFASVLRAADVYSGDAPGGPDLALEPLQGVEVRGRNTSGTPGSLLPLAELGVYYPSGVHTPVGMIVAAGAGIEKAGRVDETDIHQVAPSVLAVIGVPAPALDGRPFGFVTSSYVTTGDAPPEVEAEGTDLRADEEAEVLERLRGLGYVD
jgi:predicted AlkP superfamily phosphohydrolase/phosphomutase